MLSGVLPQPPAGVFYKIVASDINDHGVVTGYIRENTTQNKIGFTWSPSGGATLMTPPAGASYLQDVRPAAINNAGVVAGVMGYAVGGARPFVYDAARGVRDLATLTTLSTITFNYWYASAINDQGWITAYGYTGNGFASAVLRPAAVCYANCDGSAAAPVLNIADFSCFLQKYAAGDAYANCDQSVTPPVLNIADFTCFLQKFAAGCP
jgi:hypothetical protein